MTTKTIYEFEVFDFKTGELLGGTGVTADDPDTALENASKWAEKTFPNKELHVEASGFNEPYLKDA